MYMSTSLMRKRPPLVAIVQSNNKEIWKFPDHPHAVRPRVVFPAARTMSPSNQFEDLGSAFRIPARQFWWHNKNPGIPGNQLSGNSRGKKGIPGCGRIH